MNAEGDALAVLRAIPIFKLSLRDPFYVVRKVIEIIEQRQIGLGFITIYEAVTIGIKLIKAGSRAVVIWRGLARMHGNLGAIAGGEMGSAVLRLAACGYSEQTSGNDQSEQTIRFHIQFSNS